jgi:hypothetical protein
MFAPVECGDAAGWAASVSRWSGLVRMSAQSSAAAGWAASVSRWLALVRMFTVSNAATQRAPLRRCHAGGHWCGCPASLERGVGGSPVGTGVASVLSSLGLTC